MRPELRPELSWRSSSASPIMERTDVFTGGGGGGYEIRTREGVNPTRFPSVRPRPLGESSAEKDTEPPAPRQLGSA
jgi:hypothetical protein